MQARQAILRVTAKPDVMSYVGRIVRMTREMDKVLMGASSRAAVHLLQASKVRGPAERPQLRQPRRREARLPSGAASSAHAAAGRLRRGFHDG